MSATVEQKEWKDWCFDDRREELIVRFTIEKMDDGNGYQISANIYKSKTPWDSYHIQSISFASPFALNYTFQNGDRLEGVLTWQSSNAALTSFEQQIVSRLALHSVFLQETWNYGGYMVGFGQRYSPPPTPDIPIPSPTPGPDPIVDEAFSLNISQAHLQPQELFPYIYMQPWPSIASSDFNKAFISVSDFVSADSVLWQQLVAEKGKKDRDAMIKTAVDYINLGVEAQASQSTPAFEYGFVLSPCTLKSCLSNNMYVWQLIHKEDGLSFDRLSEIVQTVFGGWEAYIVAVKEDTYQQDLVRIWNSFIALNICLGYRHAILQNLIIILMVNQLLSYVAKGLTLAKKQPKLLKDAGGGDGEKKIDEKVDVPTGCEGVTVDKKPSSILIETCLNATVIMPGAIFPLPYTGTPLIVDAKDISKAVSKNAEWIVPYAMGTTASVEYELIGYELGEVQKIENILRGEIRKNSNRQLTKKSSMIEQNTSDVDMRKDDLGHASTDLINQVQKTLSDHVTQTKIDAYDTDYGMPTDQSVKTTGNWVVQEQPAGGYEKDISKFSKDIIDKTVKRISREVQHTRNLFEFEENEVMDVAKYDNVSGGDNIRGIYQWVNKKYRVISRDLGNRLVLELMIDKPSTFFLAALQQYFDIKLEAPLSPSDMGVKGYSDISPTPVAAKTPSPDKDDDEAKAKAKAKAAKTAGTKEAPTKAFVYYLDLYEQFGVENIIKPLKSMLTVTQSIKSRNPVSGATIDIPEGYDVKSVLVNVTSFSDKPNITIVVGSDVVIAGTVKDITGNFKKLPVALLSKPAATTSEAVAQSDSLPEPDQSPAQGANEYTTYYVATIDVECTLSDEALNEWQYTAYQNIEKAYDIQFASYLAALKGQKDALAQVNPEFLKDVINNQIIQGCLSLFYKNYQALTQTTPEGVTQDVTNPALAVSKDTTENLMGMVGQPRCFSYSRNCLSWSDISCQIYKGSLGDINMEEGLSALLNELSPDMQFRNFLRSQKARILVPVKKEYTQSFLYFLRSAAIWPCEERFTPCLKSDIETIDKLKKENAASVRQKASSNEDWVIRVPTSMSMLRDSQDLPSFGDWL